ncbi:MAG: hypothetical protein ABIP51_18360, partial [Bacteroidia bacterium]
MKKIIFIISSFIATTFLPAQVTTGFQWAKSFGGSTADHSNNVILDASGNIYTTGSFSGTADFDPGAATYTLTSMGDNDIFILKLDASGNFVWAKQIGSTGVDIGGALSIDSLDNIFCVGIFSGPADFDPGINTNTLNVIGAVDSYILKLDVAGNFIWVKQLGGVGNTYINRCRNDAFGNTYIGGVFENTIDLD